jgi:uroporphyrinogen decarboxylase
MMEPLGRHYGVADVRASVIRDHQVMREVKSLQEPLSADTFRDEFGAIWQQGAEAHVTRPALARPSLEGYTFPDLSTPAHMAGLGEWLDAHHDRFKIVQLGMLFWERTWFMRGMAHIMMDLYDAPAFVDALMEGLEGVCTAVIDRLLADYGERIDAIGFSEDLGTQRGLQMSPACWRRFLKPGQARMYERIRAAGKVLYLHSCGDVSPIVGELVDMGVNMLQPIQPEAMDVYALKREYGRHLCFAGGVGTQWTLPFGTPEQVRAEVAERIAVLGQGGGYVVAPAKPILPGVPIANAAALIDAIVGQAPR